jgi:hypothetical protein
MKKLLIFLISILCLTSPMRSQINEATIVGDAEITFENTKHDYGTIPYNGNGSYDYVFTNNGRTPLIITNCKKGCGCTAVSWTKGPVLPGQKGKVTATYNTRNIGYFNKGVDVFSNSTTPKINLRLLGTVAEPSIDSQKDFAKDGPTMIFERTDYDLGSIIKNQSIVCEIKFKNTGKTDLQVINTIKNKGVVSIDINRQTINSGKQGSVKVTCSSSTVGEFETSVIFYTNAGVPKIVHLKGIIIT